MNGVDFPLKQFRLQQGVRLVELAKLSGIHFSSLSLIENGWRPLRRTDADSLIQAYKKLNIDARSEIRTLATA